jgi:hypothetical protein
MIRNTQYAIHNISLLSSLLSSLFSPRSPLLWLSLALPAALLYLAVSAWVFGFSGFPLDDAWIHQTYARNLARSGQLAFTPGVPSAGSTALLWTLLLSAGYVLSIPFKVWTYSLGILFLGLTGWTVFRLGPRLFPQQRRVGLWAGLFCVFEWHLVWAAVSGMETILFVWLSLLLFERYLAYHSPLPAPEWAPPRSPACTQMGAPLQDFSLGSIGGLLTLTRPEGLGLVGVIGLDVAYRGWRNSEELKGTQGNLETPSVPTSSSKFLRVMWRWLFVAVGVGILLIPYALFHLALTGLPFPNTLYAKQAEYGMILQTYPLWQRLFGAFGSPPVETVQGVFRVVFIGPQFLLLPGLILAGWLTIKERCPELWPVWVWWIGYLLLYGFRLAVTYQHGRYQIPAIPWIILLGVWGTIRLAAWLARQNMAGRVAGRALVLSVGLLVLAFTLIGAQAYGRDVRFIESEMVATARWLQQHSEVNTVIAAHDIGAIGYFTQQPLLDLAGLVTPEIIPIIRDEAALFDFMVAQQADYLVTFPNWYPQLKHNPKLKLFYRSNAPWTSQIGGENMAVYKIIH